jgi:agmatinase
VKHSPWSLSLLVMLAVPLALAQSPAAEKKREDDAVIRLNEKDPTLNDWKKLRDTSKDPKREPGPIHINRQWAGGWSGIPTFFGMPVALNPEDLKAGKVDVAIMGAPLDTGSGMKGAAFGPRALRTSEKYLSSGAEDTDPHLHVMVNWNAVLNVVDYGDAPIDYLSGERSMQPIREMVRDVAKTGTIPFIVGGDHSLEYPNVAGVADVHGKENVGVIHFDSHYDAGKGFAGHLISHGRPIRRLIEEGHVLGKNYIQVGLRGYWPGEDGFKWMREQGFRYHTMAEIERDGWPAVMKRVLEEANDGPKHLYISLDIDVLDPSYAPGTGTPEPGGLTTRELFPLVRGLCTEKNLVGFDLVELNPLVDPGYTTALNANRLIQECLTGIAMRKKGITRPDYLSPLTVEHGRPKSN